MGATDAVSLDRPSGCAIIRRSAFTVFQPFGYFGALKRASTAMDIYDHPQEIQIAERRLFEGREVSPASYRRAEFSVL
jgi:hypothetical protein